MGKNGDFMENAENFFEEDQNYRIVIQGRNFLVTEAMRNYVFNKFEKIERFGTHIIDVHVLLEIQRIEQSCTIVLRFNHFKVKASAVSSDMYASIDKTIDRLQRLLVRWKDKIEDHHKKNHVSTAMNVRIVQRNELAEINDDIDAETAKQEEEMLRPHHVTKEETRLLKILSTEEAVMKMDLSGDHFMIYCDEASRALKVVYRRDDGNYGIIEPQT